MENIDEIAGILSKVTWLYGNKDLNAIEVLKNRIEQVGKTNSLISHSELVCGVEFKMKNVYNGEPFYLGEGGWTNLDRAILGDCLGFISKESYQKGKFMASALVVSKSNSAPSDYFFKWMKTIKALPDLTEKMQLEFWSDQLYRAYAWYQSGKSI